jgi:holo-[acyl-carrier protein] synthase
VSERAGEPRISGATLGVGVHLVDTEGFTAQLDEPESGFVDATFTPSEQRDARGAPAQRALRLAARFAAKEAFVKAWSSARYGRPPMLGRLDLRDIELVHDAYGRPELALHGEVDVALRALAAELGCELLRTHVSLSHGGHAAIAFVIVAAG